MTVTEALRENRLAPANGLLLNNQEVVAVRVRHDKRDRLMRNVVPVHKLESLLDVEYFEHPGRAECHAPRGIAIRHTQKRARVETHRASGEPAADLYDHAAVGADRRHVI